MARLTQETTTDGKAAWVLPGDLGRPFEDRWLNLAFVLLLGCMTLVGVGLLILAAGVALQMLGGSGL
jgi:hypothetical protein